jgi:enamine deaminase RidA (YjgF/YER057c/UK114 family)
VKELAFVDVPGWPKPKGYQNGTVVRGKVLFVAGQIGWNAEQKFTSDDLVDQLAQTLDNVLAVVRAAGGGPEDIAKMTIYVTDVAAYRAGVKRIGPIWRERLGRHFPAMALVGVTELVEPRAKVEIETTVVLDDDKEGA